LIKDQPAEILLQATDDTFPLSFAIGTQPTYGTLTGQEQTWTYTPNSGYVGEDFFEFSVTDTGGLSDTGRVDLNVLEPGGGEPVVVSGPSAPIVVTDFSGYVSYDDMKLPGETGGSSAEATDPSGK